MDHDAPIERPHAEDGAEVFLVRDVEGGPVSIFWTRSGNASEHDTPGSRADASVVIDLGPYGSLSIVSTAPDEASLDACRYAIEGSRDGSVGRRLVACLLCDAEDVPQGCKAIARHLHLRWTADLARLFGPVPKGRTVRLWRATRGRTLRRDTADMTSARGRSRPQQRFDPSVDKMLDRISASALAAGMTGKEAYHRLLREMGASHHDSVDARRFPSLRTVTRRMRAARIRNPGRRFGEAGSATDHCVPARPDPTGGS